MVGLALMMTPLMTESLGALPDHLYSHGSAIIATLQQVAGALGTAVFVTVAALGSAADSGSPGRRRAARRVRRRRDASGCSSSSRRCSSAVLPPRKPLRPLRRRRSEPDAGPHGLTVV